MHAGEFRRYPGGYSGECRHRIRIVLNVERDIVDIKFFQSEGIGLGGASHTDYGMGAEPFAHGRRFLARGRRQMHPVHLQLVDEVNIIVNRKKSLCVAAYGQELFGGPGLVGAGAELYPAASAGKRRTGLPGGCEL